jgi:hypothetical protein
MCVCVYVCMYVCVYVCTKVILCMFSLIACVFCAFVRAKLGFTYFEVYLHVLSVLISGICHSYISIPHHIILPSPLCCYLSLVSTLNSAVSL